MAMKKGPQEMEWIPELLAERIVTNETGNTRPHEELAGAIEANVVRARPSDRALDRPEINRSDLLAWLRPSPKTNAGRKPKDIWSVIFVEAGAWLALETGGPADKPTQADVERFIAERLEAHREEAADSTIREKARFIIEVFANRGR